MIGKRVSVVVPTGWSCLDKSDVIVAGVVERVDTRPWGTDALVLLDTPTRVGHPDHLEATHLSVSTCTLYPEDVGG